MKVCFYAFIRSGETCGTVIRWRDPLSSPIGSGWPRVHHIITLGTTLVSLAWDDGIRWKACSKHIVSFYELDMSLSIYTLPFRKGTRCLPKCFLNHYEVALKMPPEKLMLQWTSPGHIVATATMASLSISSTDPWPSPYTAPKPPKGFCRTP